MTRRCASTLKTGTLMSKPILAPTSAPSTASATPLKMFSTSAAAAPPLRGWPLLRLGFRPFYLGAAVMACLSVPFWLALFLGQVTVTLAVPPLFWHAHEMLFGFAVAVIIGFLLTAGKAWTGLATPRGPFLGALALLWVGARITAVSGPYPLYALLDLILLPLVAVLLGVLLLRAKNYRNLPLVLILTLLSCVNLAFHLSVMGVVSLPPLRVLHASLALVVMIACIMAGRVVPAFTMAATPGLKLRARPMLEQATLVSTALGLLLWVLAPAAGLLTMGVLLLAAALHIARQALWCPWVSRSRPILWILHVSYAWLAIGFALLALAQMGLVTVSAGVHALGIGVTGGLIIGMITRTARGHTGRTLRASTTEVVAYGLVMLTAVLRVLLPLAAPQWFLPALVAAALAWCLAFALYLFVYTPWLCATRLDGKDG